MWSRLHVFSIGSSRQNRRSRWVCKRVRAEPSPRAGEAEVGKSAKFGTIAGTGRRLLEPVEKPEFGFDLAFLGAENTVLVSATACCTKFALTPNTSRHILAGLVTGRFHIYLTVCAAYDGLARTDHTRNSLER